ncbi:FMRFamide receptor-like [Physella acuta]|uniref:FMRFamide receptor-like n=1 Tax=Physella acuta TaxID=109671 RepID=UPI0027DB1FF9|nr:FMRFamide receptor-like [Physella acuta]
MDNTTASLTLLDFSCQFAWNLSLHDANPTHDPTSDEIVDAATRRLWMKILMFAVTPGIGVLGVVGNMLSILILLRHGLKKCSNILLVSLAVADIIFLIAYNSIPKILYETSDIRGFEGFSELSSQILVVFYAIFMCLDFAASLVSLTMPMLITLERLIVIFFPLSAYRIVTPKRTWCAVIIVVLYSLSLFVYPSFWFELKYEWDPTRNISVGFREFSILHTKDSIAARVIEDMCIYSIVVVPPLFTVLGCIIISIKVKVVSMNRKKMTTKQVSSNRTTIMLLAVCAVYTLTCVTMTVPINVPIISYGPYSETHPSNLAVIMYQVMNIFMCINSSCNFIIYVGLNKNFRKTYLELCSSKQRLNSLKSARYEQKSDSQARSRQTQVSVVSSAQDGAVSSAQQDDDDF